MALIKCAECEKEISDQASTCPNCGYKLSTDTDFRKTEINYLPSKKITGTISLLAGIACIISGIISLFFIFTIIMGILAIIEFGFGAALIKNGIHSIKGSLQEADCPYCGKKLTFDENANNIRNQNHLTSIK